MKKEPGGRFGFMVRGTVLVADDLPVVAGEVRAAEEFAELD